MKAGNTCAAHASYYPWYGMAMRCATTILLTAVTAIGFMSLSFPASAQGTVSCRTSAAAGQDWHGCNKRNLVLEGGNLEGSNLLSTDFTMTDLGSANLKSANLEKATLVRSSLAGATAQNANFTKVEAYRCNFSEMVADNALFVSSELQRTNFREARLPGANFAKAELGRANFEKAILTGARFPMANLSRANLNNAIVDGPVDFTDAFLFLTRIEDLDLSMAVGLKQDQVNLACGSPATKLPAGLQTPPGWPCPEDDTELSKP